MRAKVAEEKEKEKKMLKELERGRDHQDLFYVEACYGLHRLLPRQVQTLANDWMVQGTSFYKD